ncbi:MAG: hypothetical protein AAGH64_02945 [Planctomycetota bacterium]
MRRPPFRAAAAALVLALAGLASTEAVAAPQGTAFSYQGVLSRSGVSVVASTDLRFTLWDAESGGSAIGSSVLLTVTPEEGVFSVDLDFGSDPFGTNEARWLGIEASPAGMGMFEPLGRTPLRATTYSLSTRGISVDADDNIGIGTDTPDANVHINERGTDYGPTSFASNTVLGVSASDAVLELVSDETGSFGSTLGFKQVNSVTGALEDHWAFSVGTAGTFELRYGSGISAGANARFATFLSTGSIGVNDPSPEGRFDVSFDANSEDIGIDVEGVNTTATSIGVSSSQNAGRAVFGQTTASTGTNFGVFGEVNALNTTGWGVFSNGRLGASGTKSFCIDHPLDPANWYLLHYSTEAPEPLNTYSGNAIFDGEGLAVVDLPSYFDSINANPRYHLTPVGAAMPNLHVARTIEDGSFVVAGGVPGAQVSWQVTATRNDPYVRTIGAPVEVPKGPAQRGLYLMPELYGHPRDMGIHTRVTR